MGSTEDVLERYRQASDAGDVDAVVDLHAEDAVVISRGEVYRGREEIRSHYEDLFEWMHGTEADLDRRSRVVEGDFALLTNSLESPELSWEFGVDTVVVRDGKIAGHTVAIYRGDD